MERLEEAKKTYQITGNEFFEVVDGRLLPLNADIYHKKAGRYYVGYRHTKGTHAVYEQNGLLKLSLNNEEGGMGGRLLFRVRLYEDISGKYFPVIGEKMPCTSNAGTAKLKSSALHVTAAGAESSVTLGRASANPETVIDSGG